MKKMHREIEFRGIWYDPLIKPKKPEWIYGCLKVPQSGKRPQICSRIAEGWFVVERETVGQYTGVKDKNGKKIYEGDVVFDGEYTGIVWCFPDSAAYTVCYDGLSKHLADDHPDYLEIVGNVFDNPEYKELFGRLIGE